MNRGNLPGYYFDVEKGKYFKITKDHLVPEGTKYAKSNVKREKRELKKQKTHYRKQIHIAKHTVQKVPILRHATLSSTGIKRELGLEPRSVQRRTENASVLDHMQSGIKSQALPIDGHILHAELVDGTENMVLTVRTPGTDMFYFPHWDWDKLHQSELDNYNVRFPIGASRISALSVAPSRGYNSPPSLFFCINRLAGGSEFTVLDLSAGEPLLQNWNLTVTVFGRDPGEVPLTSTAEPVNGNFALGSDRRLYAIDSGGDESAAIDCTTVPQEVDWLNPSTVAYTQYRRQSGIHLWDTRSSGVSLRFPSKAPLTGLKCPGQNGNQIVASESRKIHLFDTRMHKKPILSFDHSHQGSKLHFTTDMPGIVAALDENNLLQTYSLLSGKHVRTLQNPGVPRGSRTLVTNLTYHDRADGRPLFQACYNDTIIRWEP